MADLAKYVRIYDPSPEDDTVNKRQAAIKDAVVQLRKTADAPSLVKLGSAVAEAFATGVTPDPIGSVVATAIKKHASAFVREERELEVAVITAVAAMELLEGPDTGNIISRNDIVAATLWSALAYQSPSSDAKLEQLRQDLLAMASDRCLKRAEAGRKRTAAPKEIPAAPDADVAQMSKSLVAATATLVALQTNASLDREELDVLWWAMGGRSPTVGKFYDILPPAVHGVVRGIELGILLRRLPARAHHSLALSRVPEVEPQTLNALIGELQGVTEALSEKIPARATVEASSAAFPLLKAILSGVAEEDGPAKTGDEWCARALLEAGLASLCQTPDPRL